MKNASRVYVCHTFYHVYVAYLKECALNKMRVGNENVDKADILLSTMSNDFSGLKERMDATGFWNQVIPFEEKHFSQFPELLSLKKDRGNIVLNMLERIRFCKLYGKLEESCIPVDFKAYQDIYVFCDSDPIGYFLSYKKIYYHALEDGLNCIQHYDTARYDNRGAFKIKAWMAAHNLIFIQNGYGKYCLDMEVNDTSVLKYPLAKYKEVPRAKLVEQLTEQDKDVILRSFLKDMDGLKQQIQAGSEQKILILSEPLCTLDAREKIFRDIVEMYKADAQIFIKPHPRDVLDYEKLFTDCVVLDGKFPMEMMNFIPGLYFDKVVSVLTVTNAIQFTRENVMLGRDFLDRYEAPEIHRQNEYI